MTQFPNLTIVDHPLVQHKLTIMRNHVTSTNSFRRLLREISLLLAYEVTRDLELTTTRIQTPLCEMDAPVLEGKKLALISILRAGNGLLDGILELIPAARVGFLGLYRDPDTLQPVQYYAKVPNDLDARMVIVVDPMLATVGALFGKGAIGVVRVSGPRPAEIDAIVAAIVGRPLVPRMATYGPFLAEDGRPIAFAVGRIASSVENL